MSKRKLGATVCSVTPVSDGFLKVKRYRFATDKHNGGVQVIEREVMERGHAVGVLGYDPLRDEVILISEFRPGCFVAGDDAYADNVVAGAIDGDETPCDAAVREMQEEAGLELSDPILIHPGAYVSSGGTSEKVALVVGIVDTSQAGGVHGNADECEDILTVVLSRREFLQRARRAEITDLKTLVAAYWLAEEYEQLSVRPAASEH
jgi:ADP-ribose pyrophosphatase